MNVALPQATAMSLHGVAQVLQLSSPEVSGFPLPANATVQELLTLVDGLAFKIYPKGYWQLSWTLNAINVTCFLSVTLALRAYRSQQTPIPFWLFKLEHRPYRVKRFFKASCKNADFSKDNDEKDDKSGQTTASLATSQEEGEVRMGRFITASCVNCHLLLTSAYVLLLFLKVTETYIVRGPLSTPPLLDPGVIDLFMLLAIFSTAYFAAFGYIALLLPNVPPWLWNGTIVLVYLGLLVIGLFLKISIAVSASKISQYRIYMYEAALHPEFGGLLNELGGLLNSSMPWMDEAMRMVLLNIAKISYKESLTHKGWQQIMQGIVMIGGYSLTISYLVILVTLSRRVAKELVQIRQSPPSHSEDKPFAPTEDFGLANWPPISARFNMPVLSSHTALDRPLGQPHRVSLPLHARARTPPPTPAPDRPLPAPPIDHSQPSSRSSTPEAIAYEDSETRERLSPAMHARTLDSGLTEPRTENRIQGRGLRAREQMLDSSHKSRRVSLPHRIDHTASMSLPSIDRPNLDLGPRTRLDSQPVPWDLNMWHEDVASNDGYVAVCRFLFNCIIDHVMVMLQCCIFGCHSAYMLYVFTTEYPDNAQVASSRDGVATMLAQGAFTVLYIVNSLNLFAPFLLFPASQVRLATMLASLTLPEADLGDDGRKRAGPAEHWRQAKASSASGNKPWQARGRSKARAKNAPTLKHQDSAKPLIRTFSQDTGDTCASAASHPSANDHLGGPSAPRAATGATRDEVATMSRKFPSTCVSAPTSPSPGFQSLKYSGRDHTGERHPLGATGSHVGSASDRSLRHSSSAGMLGQQQRAHTFSNASKFSSSQGSDHAQAPTSTSTSAHHQDQQVKATAKDSAWRFSPFSSGEKGLAFWRRPKSRDGPPPREHGQAPGGASIDMIRESNQMRVQPMGAQLVLDSLISSHSLPIQGFYCHRNTASDSTSTLRHYHWNESVEAGVSSSVFGAYSHAHRQTKDEQRRSIQALEQPRGSEVEEELSHFDVCSGDVHGSMGDASTRRRQRLRRSFRSQVEQRSLSSSDAQPTSWLGIDGLRTGTGAGRVKDGRTVKLLGAELRAQPKHGVPMIVAQPPTPRTPQLLQSEQEGNRGMRGTTIAMPACLTSLSTAFDDDEKELQIEATSPPSHETTISIPAHLTSLLNTVRLTDDDEEGFQIDVTSHSDNDDDTASIVSSTFGHS